MMQEDQEFDPDTLPTVLGQLLTYWNRIKGDRLVPSRQDFDPIEIPRLLPYLILVEVVRNGIDGRFEDFRFRLIGTHVDSRMRDRYTGRRLSEIPGKGPGSELWETYCSVKHQKRPRIISMNYIGPVKKIRETNEILLPFSSDNKHVDHIMVGLQFF